MNIEIQNYPGGACPRTSLHSLRLSRSHSKCHKNFVPTPLPPPKFRLWLRHGCGILIVAVLKVKLSLFQKDMTQTRHIDYEHYLCISYCQN
jgi:hypothetical protein